MLTNYWNAKDRYTGETWLSFAQRTGMDAVSIAYGQAWAARNHPEAQARYDDYWGARDMNTGETWLEFCRRTDMDAVSIAHGQAWRERLELLETQRGNMAVTTPR
jgi:hypothetical protein